MPGLPFPPQTQPPSQAGHVEPSQQSCPIPPQTSQADWKQISPASQAFPHWPQLPGSAVTSAQTTGGPPSTPQGVKSGAQVGVQPPSAQTSPGAQVVPQVPQFLGSVPGSKQNGVPPSGTQMVNWP